VESAWRDRSIHHPKPVMTAMVSKELTAIAWIDGGGDFEPWLIMVMTVRRIIATINMTLRRVDNRARHAIGQIS
jgi:hypothetical protein